MGTMQNYFLKSNFLCCKLYKNIFVLVFSFKTHLEVLVLLEMCNLAARKFITNLYSYDNEIFDKI